MPTIRADKNILTDELVALTEAELENFISQAMILQAKRRAPSLSQNESELLLEINLGLSPKIQQRFDELAEKIETEKIDEKERQEFLRLTDFIEKHDAKRIMLISNLAEIRQQSFEQTMKDLGIGQN